MRALLSFFVMVLAVSISFCLLTGGTAQAVLITSTASFGAPPSVMAGDLLETNATLTTAVGNFLHEGSDPPAALSNGNFPAFVGGSRAGVTTPESGSFLEYTFDTTTYPLGYEITSIVSSGGWADGGRNRQDITVSYTTVDDPLLQLLANISFDPSGNYSAVTLTDSSGSLITGLATLRLDFPNQENGFAGYGEFDVIGGIVLPAPEPASIALLGLGMCGLSVLRRQRRNNSSSGVRGTMYDINITA